MRLYLIWNEWGLHYKLRRYRLCEKTFEAGEIAIGPIWIEWNEWV